ncbi:hypothetical protein N7493_002311 [Penicillium malachiteum]|uniref:Uncharacterized protein n=1 Tax=Penicillium malachiteum TaxID=1324776 RepID=A0AAD6MYW1_9EURO|nr:hypothetical protein N7493_002311 [Penicillium malachiteum]
MEYRYGKRQGDGQHLQKWMDNAAAPKCYIRKAKLSWCDLKEDEWVHCHHPANLPPGLVPWVEELGLPEDDGNIFAPGPYQYMMLRTRHFSQPPMSWSGYIGPGVMFINRLKRDANSPLYCSDLTKAVYEQSFPLDDLKHIFVTEIVNHDTSLCAMEAYINKGLIARSAGSHTWEPYTDEFNALLGTKVGKTIGSFILASFGQGKKRIARIKTVYDQDGDDLDLQFDLEDVPSS